MDHEEHGITGRDDSDIELTRLRSLEIATNGSDRDYIAAASGLVRAGSRLYVVADDELHLGCFDVEGLEPGTLVRLFPGHLPDDAKQRKKAKPDLELLVTLPGTETSKYGSLLALGSGSGPERRRGALLQFDARHAPVGEALVLDASAFFDGLSKHVDDINFEGAWITGRVFNCLQRGHRGNVANAVVQFDLDSALATLTAGRALPAPLHIQPMSLGACRGVPLSFSDACGLPDGRWVFTAVAEDTGSAYDDGGFVGAVIGLADAALRPLWIRPIHPALKVEGIDAREAAGRLHLLLVTDADDRATPAGLYSATVL